MSSQTTAVHTDIAVRQDAIDRYEKALEAAKVATDKAAKDKANGALSGPRQAIRNAEARLFLDGVSFDPYQAETVGRKDAWNETEAREALVKLGAAWKRATGQFEYLRATYEPRIEKALKVARDHGVKLTDPR